MISMLLVLARDGEHLLSYFELLPNNVDMQVNMENYVESYHLILKSTFVNNLDYIRI